MEALPKYSVRVLTSGLLVDYNFIKTTISSGRHKLYVFILSDIENIFRNTACQNLVLC
jgi:hypothetical protein